MRYAMWSPLPPEHSGISDYTYELLATLAGTVDIAAVVRKPEVAEVPAGVPMVDPATGAQAALSIYQMGNHAGLHSWIYRQALAEPGIVVLHDTSLLDFHYAQLGGLHAPEFRDEVRYAHGPIWGSPDDPALLEGWPALDVDGVKKLDPAALTMERRLVEASRGVLVHDPFAANWLRERYPDKPVFLVPQGVELGDGPDRAVTRARFGWQDEHVVFGVFGGVHWIKRLLPTMLAFAQVRRRWPQARLLIAGRIDQPDVYADVVAAAEQFGLIDSVHLESSPSMADFRALISAADVTVNLRWPTAGETSATMMRAFAAGRLVITSDLPQNRHFDSAFCLRVPVEPMAEARQLIAAMEGILADPEQARAAGKLAGDYVNEKASLPVAAQGYRDALAELDSPKKTVRRAETRPGLNLFADLRATTGLAESARRYALALRAAGAGLTFTEFNSRAPYRTEQIPTEIGELRRGKDYPVDLWLVNLNEFLLVPDSALDRYTIGLWAWELPEVLDDTLVQLERLDELWVVSSFIADTFRTVTDIPIKVMPNVVPELTAAPDRARFGLAQDALVVLFTFSASSSAARKNPWAVIDAFGKAFRPDERGSSAQLVIKANELHRFPELHAALADAIADVDGILITDELSRPEMDALLAGCDIYASLHRCEGYGFGMAEAMMLGKPVVATGYGGNTDFMPPGAAAVVGFESRVISAVDHRFQPDSAQWYRPGQLWAEPNVGEAARWLRKLADSPALRASMGEAGRAAIKAWSSPEVVGQAMLRRLGEIR
ncbi:MAG TPA: glycosyltransferase family 4 protein [Pseudonocardiaceae bacterium]|nr:glycosyltransferase family 4 protein [Pseudonocardiaceae bacterium]